MIRRIIRLIANDLAVAYKNKTLYLILFIPLFVFATLTLVDSKDAAVSSVKLGLLHTEHYDPAMLSGLRSATSAFAIAWFSDEEDGMLALKERIVDGFLVNADGTPSRVTLVVTKREAFQTLAIVQNLSSLQTAMEGRGTSWISEIRPLQHSTIKLQTLPTWILMMVLLVSFIIIPSQVAEEKEKQWLLALLQTPMRECEWLVSKLAYGIILVFASVLGLQLLGRISSGHWPSYLAMLGAGGFCFITMGICLGLLCRSQASARTFGVLCYLPLLMPAALSDASKKLSVLAPLLPTYPFYEPIRAILLDDRSAVMFLHEWLILLGIGVLACLGSYQLIKKRWLM